MIAVNEIGGDLAGFDALLYPHQKMLSKEYIDSQIKPIVQLASERVDAMINKAVEMYDNFNSTEIMAKARSALNAATGIVGDAVIRVVPIDSLHSAGSYMQRWIMAEPTIRRLYEDDLCDGYYGTYTDMFPGTIEEDHYDYRRVTHGVMMDSKDEDCWEMTFYTETLLNSDDDLSALDKFDILDTWENVRLAIANGDDPTNPDEGKL